MAELEPPKKLNLELKIKSQTFSDIMTEEKIGGLVTETYFVENKDICGEISINRIYNNEGKLLLSLVAKSEESFSLQEQLYIAQLFGLKDIGGFSRKSEHRFY